MALTALAACALNPATGESQLSLFDEAEEVALGAEVDREFLSHFGIYDAPELAAYVSRLGARLAAVSERPDLGWSFRIADDETVNAFALPGGRIYVTRGLLAHLDREAELAGVLAHEVGHVTARHSVTGLSRELALTLGIAAGLELLEVGDTGEIVSSIGLGLLFLKFGRNQERQADQLAVRYAERAGFDAHGVVDALEALRRVSEAQDEGWLPVWLSTHPDPERRAERLAEEADLGPGSAAAALVPEIDLYRSRLDGLAYGPDPRNGVVRDNVYRHLHDGFEVTFPPGWRIEREGRSVWAESASDEALVLLTPQTAASIEGAAIAFGDEEGIQLGEGWYEDLGGLAARVVPFGAGKVGDGAQGLAAFAQVRGRVMAILALSTTETFPRHRRTLARSLRSFAAAARPGPDAPRPDRLSIVTLDRAMTAREIARRYAPGASPATVALLNRVGADRPFAAGRRVKIVLGTE